MNWKILKLVYYRKKAPLKNAINTHAHASNMLL